jgi:RNA ligase
LRLSNLLDTKLLHEHILNGVVSQTQHRDFPELFVYNYTHVAQHDNVWDNVTEQCRGLVCRQECANDVNPIWLLDHQIVIARPFRKFFNLNTSFRPETQEANLPFDQAPRVLEKLDGSLGILFWHGWRKEPIIATRGSFGSDQAQWATKWYRAKFGNWPIPDSSVWPEGYTPLFEIIYNENRIVVNYDYEGLVLLGLVNVSTGAELPPEEVEIWARKNSLRVPIEYAKSIEECKSEKVPNMEGFVLQYWNQATSVPLRLKIKTEDYVRLHKIITGLNPKGIWEHLAQGGDPEALWVPAFQNKPFVAWCQGWISTFQRMYDETEQEVIRAFGRVAMAALHEINAAKTKLDERAARKCWALAIQQEPGSLHKILFACLSGKDWKKLIWNTLEPEIQGKDVYIRDADVNNGI